MNQLQHWYQTDTGRRLIATEWSYLRLLLSWSCPWVQLAGPEHPADPLWQGSRLHMARQGFPDVVGDLLQLPMQSQSINQLVLWHALECVADPSLLIQEAYRVLAPGGFVVVCSFNGRSLGRFQDASVAWPWRQSLGRVSEAPKLMRSVGLTVAWQQASVWWPVQWGMPHWVERTLQLGAPQWGILSMCVAYKQAYSPLLRPKWPRLYRMRGVRGKVCARIGHEDG